MFSSSFHPIVLKRGERKVSLMKRWMILFTAVLNLSVSADANATMPMSSDDKKVHLGQCRPGANITKAESTPPPLDPVDASLSVPENSPIHPENNNASSAIPTSHQHLSDQEISAKSHSLNVMNPTNWKHELRLGGSGSWGAQAGVAFWVTAPYVFPGASTFPGMGIAGHYRAMMTQKTRLTFSFTTSAGGANDETGYNFTGGYGLSISAGMNWFDLGWLQLWTDAHVMARSRWWFPIPQWGLGADLVFILWSAKYFQWDATLALDTDAVLILPVVSAAASTEMEARYNNLGVGVNVQVRGGASVLGVVNAVSATADAQLYMRYRFD